MKRLESIAQSYLKTGLFVPEKLAYGSQILYEVEQDNIAMKWALERMKEFLDANKDEQPTHKKYMMIDIAYRDLLKRVSEYNCPSLLKDQHVTQEKCPLGNLCKFPECRQ